MLCPCPNMFKLQLLCLSSYPLTPSHPASPCLALHPHCHMIEAFPLAVNSPCSLHPKSLWLKTHGSHNLSTDVTNAGPSLITPQSEPHLCLECFLLYIEVILTLFCTFLNLPCSPFHSFSFYLSSFSSNVLAPPSPLLSTCLMHNIALLPTI